MELSETSHCFYQICKISQSSSSLLKAKPSIFRSMLKSPGFDIASSEQMHSEKLSSKSLFFCK